MEPQLALNPFELLERSENKKLRRTKNIGNYKVYDAVGTMDVGGRFHVFDRPIAFLSSNLVSVIQQFEDAGGLKGIRRKSNWRGHSICPSCGIHALKCPHFFCGPPYHQKRKGYRKACKDRIRRRGVLKWI